MSAPRIYLAISLVALELFALYIGIVRRPAVAWWIVLVLIPPLVVFVWWTTDRAALERRIKRLEARSEIADERRIVIQTDLTEVGQKLNGIETRVSDVENVEAGSRKRA